MEPVPGRPTHRRHRDHLADRPARAHLRDLIDIVPTLQTRGIGVRSLSNGIVDTTTAHGALVFGMFALMAECEAALIRERTVSPPPAPAAAPADANPR